MRPIFTTTTLALALVTAAAAVPAQAQEGDPPVPEALTATAELSAPDGRKIGLVRLRETPFGGVLVRVEVEGLEPGPHGFHIHETGRCEAPDFSSAGGHFAPRGNSHGFYTAWGPHAGDMPNLHVGADGSETAERLAAGVTLRDGHPASLVDADGSAIVIHGGADDYVSQPSGAAGPRVACGVVRR